MLEYISKKKALELGMTHHGSYFGIPVWMAPDDPDFLCCTKWGPMEYVMEVFCFVEGTMRSVLYPMDEPIFQFKVGSRIV